MNARPNLATGRARAGFSVLTRTAIVLVAAAAIATITPCISWAAEDAGDLVVATIGSHRITQKELDAAVLAGISKTQLYDLRKQALDKLIDDYLVNAAAKKAQLTPDAYLDRELHGGGTKVTEADAHKYYDAHKAAIDRQIGARTYKDIAPLLVAALQRHDDRSRRDALMAKLRSEAKVKVALEAPRVNVAVGPGHPSTGGNNAPVTIVEFSDFQCPYCRAAEPVLKQIRAKYGDKVKLVYMDFPLGMHPHAMDAAVAGRCAGEQGKFWQLHDAMFSDQTKLDAPGLKASAAKAGLDSAKFSACFDKKAAIPAIKADQAEGERLGVTGTPTFFVNGRQMVGMESEKALSDVIDDELAHAGSPAAQAGAH